MRKLLSTCVLALAAFGCTFGQAPATFSHPGIFNSQTELDFIKSTVAANNGSPIVAGYQTLSNDSKGSLSYNAQPFASVYVVGSGSSPSEDAFRRDAHAAYIHAIKWVVTGNSAHRDKSIQILNAWSATFQNITHEPEKPNQPTLEASWALPIWLAGAEIMKSYNNGAANWSATDRSRFESFARKIITYVNGPIASAPNWYISKGLSLLAAGVYLNEAATFNQGYNIIVPQLDAITTSGQIPELTRDFVHSQYVLIGLAQAAEVAFQQGNSGLFTRTNGASQPRLLLGTEHYTRCLMGTNTPNYQAESAWARKSAPYEILLLRYNQLGMSVPNTQSYVLNQNRVEDGIENHFLGWHTATHSQLPTVSQSPFNGSPTPIPGRVEAENYDNGGQGVAYNDNTAGNTGGVYRADNVDIQAAPEGGYAIGWIAQGEWLEYTVNVNTAGAYTLTARVSATTAGKTFHVELDGQNISGAINIPVTGSYQTYTSVSVTTPSLTTGQKTLRIVMDASSYNISYLQFDPVATPQSPYSGSAAPIPGKIEAENYDFGGQGVAYNDLTTGNSGGAYRNDNVDIEATTDTGGGHNIGWIDSGEWLEYTVNVAMPGTYTLAARVAATATGKTFHVELDGQNISGAITVPNTGGYQAFTTVNVVTSPLTTGQKVLRIVMDGAGFNLNHITFSAQSSENIALNKTAVASTTEATGFEPSKAVDGNATTTRWSSAFSDPQWLYVDLGATYDVNRVKITWEAAYATAYQIQVSANSGGPWTTIRSVTGNTTLVNDQTGLSGSGRYVRINGTARATVYGYSIFELEVYGTPTGGRLAVNEQSNEGDLNVVAYPNPAANEVTVEVSELFNNAGITLYSQTGKAISEGTIKNRTHRFDLKHLPEGLYLIRVANAGRQVTQKVIKQTR